MNYRALFLPLAMACLGGLAAAGQESLSAEKKPATTQQQSWDQAITHITAWQVNSTLGTRKPVEVDTIWQDYAQSVAIPSLQYGYASTITGNLGAEGVNMIYFDRPAPGKFMFADALTANLPSIESTRFYNNRVPMTLLSYNTSYGKESLQDRLRAVFNGNINKRAQIGAHVDYLYSKGTYDLQAAKHVNWGANASYLGDKYQMMALFNQFHSVNKENGGIQDDLYITDPAEMQGGNSKIRAKNIPVNLQGAHSRINGKQAWLSNAYNLGFHRTNPDDSTSVFVPVTRIFMTNSYEQFGHRFIDKPASDQKFWSDSFFNPSATREEQHSYVLTNTIGVELLEGFRKWVKFGLTAYAMHEYEQYRQNPGYESEGIPRRHHHNSLSVGARLAKEQGAHLRYDADGRVCLAGENLGETDLNGQLQLRVRMLGDTAAVKAYGQFQAFKASNFVEQYVGNHFIWNNHYGMTRRVRFGGEIDFPQSWTNLTAGVENIQNLVYFGSDFLPVQHSGSVQVISATLNQGLHFGIWHWQNTITFQTSTNQTVIPLPKLALLSNMYIQFRFHTLHVQLGTQCNYMTEYNALAYQPATMVFANQQEVKAGNYPMMDAYINFKLSKVRFYALLSHWNQGLFGGTNYFSAVHYPLNPRRFLFGLSVDFAN